MAITINTSDPLYGALTHLFCVDDDNTVKELRKNLALTVASGVLLPNSPGAKSTTTPYGRSFRTMPGTSPYDFSQSVSFAAQLVNTNGPISVFIAMNRYNGDSSAGYFSADMLGSSGPLIRMRQGGKLTSATYPGVAKPGASTTGALTTAENTLCLTRNGSGAHSVFMYLNGAIDPAFAGGLSNAAGEFGATDPPQTCETIGGTPGFGWVSCDWVYIAIFATTQISAADVARLHSSLTGANRFALVNVPGGDTTAPVLTGAITASAVTSTSYTLAWPAATDAVGVAGYEYSLNGGTSYTGAGTARTVNISGRTAGTTDQVRVRAFDAAGNRSTPPLALAVTLSGGSSGGTVVSDVISNGSGTVLANTLFSYSYFPGGRFGSMTGITPREGTVTSDAGGRCTIASLPAGSGVLLLANRLSSAATDNVYYQAVTVA